MFLQLRRNRGLQILIIGFILITIYMYYRTSIDDYHPVIEFLNTSNLPARHSKPPVEVVENYNLETVILLALNKTKNFESTSVNASYTANPNSSLQETSLLSTSLSSGSAINHQSLQSSLSTSVNVPTSNSTTNVQQISQASKSLMNNGNINSNSNNSIVSILSRNDDNDTTRAIYQSGHDVPISEKCPSQGKDMNLVIIVMSAPTHIEARTAIRQTWGHFGQRTDVSVVFMLGTTADSKLQKLLQYEQKLYADIIRGRFIDSYANLTLKTMSSLEWVDTYCFKSKFVLKTDDDMFINVPRLLAFVKKHEKDQNIIFGRLARKWKPIRNKKSKYYVSIEQFKQKMFPDFTTGPAYLLSQDVVRKLFDAAMMQTYLKLEDVFTTGIVAHKLGIKRVHVSEFLNKRITYSPCNVQRGISIHMVKYGEQFDLWKKLLDGKSKCK